MLPQDIHWSGFQSQWPTAILETTMIHDDSNEIDLLSNKPIRKLFVIIYFILTSINHSLAIHKIINQPFINQYKSTTTDGY